MRDCIVGNVPGNRFPIKGDGSFAHRASTIRCMRSELWIGSQIPEQDGTTPVSGCADNQPLHRGCDIELWIVFAVDDQLLGEVQIFPGIHTVNFRQRGNFPTVKMESRPIDILSRLGIVQDGERVIWPVAIVIVEEYFCLKVYFTKRRSERLLDEGRLLFRLHYHAGRVLWIQRFVLDGYGIDLDTLRLHSGEILY